MLKLIAFFAAALSLICVVLVGVISRSWGATSALPNDPLVLLTVDRNYRPVGMIMPSAAERAIVPLTYQGHTLNDVSCSADGSLIRFTDAGEPHWIGFQGEVAAPPAETVNALPMGMTDRMAMNLGENYRQQTMMPSPDGGWIVYTQNPTVTEINMELWLIPTDASAPARRIGSGSQPAWSPDSRLIAYAQAFQEGDALNYELMLMDVARGDAFRLTHSPFFDLYPAWSLDGSQIVFSTQRSGTPQVFVMNANGRDPRLLTSTPNVFRLCFLRSLPAALIAVNPTE